ncbi:Arm DNA-binding domain-containing protein, partial [Flavobacteriales bacterium]|nr:Arm DNA-binding domain-containing protein [Flavobacteriales bacterium]
MRPKFYLKRAYNTKSAVDMVCRFNGKRFKVGVGLTVKTENWSKKKQRLKERVTKGIEMNAYLDKCERIVLEIFYQFKKSGTLPSPKFIRKEFSHQVKGVPRGDSFFEFFQKHINQQEPNWQRST